MMCLVLQCSRTDDQCDSGQQLVVAPGIGAIFPTSPEQSPSGFRVQRSPTGAISARDATLPFPPILNLTGPPSMAPEDAESHPRKKRRRRKKKKPVGDPLSGSGV